MLVVDGNFDKRVRLTSPEAESIAKSNFDIIEIF